MKKFFGPFKTRPPSKSSTGRQNTFLDCMSEDESAGSNQSSSFLTEYRAFRRIHRAASAGNAARVERMLSFEQKDVNETDKKNRTALHYACAYGHPEVAKLLIEWECEIDACDSDNCTPLIKASQYQCEQCVEILLEHGANPNAMDEKGYTALHYSVHTENTAIAAKLMKHNASLTARTKAGFTPLSLAVNENKEAMAKLLGNGEENMYATGFINSNKERLKEYEEKTLQTASCRSQEPEIGLNVENDKSSLDESDNHQLENDSIQSLVSVEEREEQLISNGSEHLSWASDEEDSFFHSKEAPKINLRKKWKAFKKSRNIRNSGLPWSDDTDTESENKEENSREPALGKEENVIYLTGTLVQEKEEAEESPWDYENVSESIPFICAGNEPVATYEATKGKVNGHVEECPEKHVNWKEETTEPAIGQNQNGMTCEQDLRIKNYEDLPYNFEAEEKRKKHKTKKDYKVNKVQAYTELLGGGGGGDSAAAAASDDNEEEDGIEEEENKDLSDDESILQRKKENADKHKFPVKRGEEHDECGRGPICHLKVTKERQGENFNNLESENTSASEEFTSTSCHQVKDECSSSKIDLDGGRSQDKSSNKKYKIQKQMYAMEDQDDLSHSFNYDNGDPSNQKDLLCPYENQIQSKNSGHELYEGKIKKMANKIRGIRTDQSETKEMKAHLENVKVELTELCNLRYRLQQEIKKNGNAVHISENLQSVLRENKEQLNKAVGVKQLETSPRTMYMEVNDIKNVLKQLQEIKSQHTEVVHSSKKMQDHRQKFKKHLKVSKKRVNENENGEFTVYEDLETRELAMDVTVLRDEVNDFKEKMETISCKDHHLSENIQCKIQELSAIKNIQKKYEYLHMKQKKIEREILILTSHIQEKMKQAADQANLKELRDKNTGQRISQLRLIFKDMKLKHSKIKSKNDSDKMEIERYKQDYMEVYTTRKALSNTLLQMKEILQVARTK
ncbi:ankyrin repeat domain-containing protein 26-like isoform X2 [Dipodomys merriami]|uniref:ankyrin repeat domain-containing protein 26-like isoform X2 n=1 Tax=Dipodomys merriami TaxID=94247 RepID=UPI003855E180